MQTGMNPGPGCSWLGALWWRRQFCDSQPVELRGESDLQVERLAGFELGDPCELGGVVGPFAVGLAAAACGDGDDEADERLRLGCGAAGCWFGAGDFGLQGRFAGTPPSGGLGPGVSGAGAEELASAAGGSGAVGRVASSADAGAVMRLAAVRTEKRRSGMGARVRRFFHG